MLTSILSLIWKWIWNTSMNQLSDYVCKELQGFLFCIYQNPFIIQSFHAGSTIKKNNLLHKKIIWYSFSENTLLLLSLSLELSDTIKDISKGHIIIITWEHRAASSWNEPPTNMQYSGVVILHWPRIPMQQGWPITSQTMCSAAWPCPLASKVSTSILRRQIGHLVMSSGQT